PTFNYTNAENTVVKGIRAVSSWAIDGCLQGLDKEARRTLGPCQGSAHQWVKLYGGWSKYGASNPVSAHWRGGCAGGLPPRVVHCDAHAADGPSPVVCSCTTGHPRSALRQS